MGGGPSEFILAASSSPKPEKLIQKLIDDHPGIEVEYCQCNASKDVPKELFKKCTILLTLSILPEDPKNDTPNLKLVHFWSAGINHVVDKAIYKDSDITLTTSNGIHGPQISEWIIMTMLVQSHNYNRFHDQQKERKWDPSKLAVDDMVGQRIGILGYGSIGRQTGRVAKAMGMDVVAYTASPRETPESKKDNGFIVPGTGDPDGSIPSAWYSGLDKKSLHNFLSQDLDAIAISLPLTDDTKHMISKPEFDILSKKRTFISNISRGPIINTDDLIAALKEDKTRGCALDVTDPEPLPEDSELWGMSNVTITPHISGNGSAYMDRVFQLLSQNLTRMENGEKLINVVNRKRGY